ncbi:hypothetical protein CVT26_001084 [Gymnopilus dilepis]|uniref:Uncharacterized protein n=1 Tax=Gymnopilus dilepis TaxID=231916 RepID=A0A409WLB2_9AGAR|nr:hypothetical protein CVT26_001084 [Gymnopilus dilepis]
MLNLPREASDGFSQSKIHRGVISKAQQRFGHSATSIWRMMHLIPEAGAVDRQMIMLTASAAMYCSSL